MNCWVAVSRPVETLKPLVISTPSSTAFYDTVLDKTSKFLALSQTQHFPEATTSL